MLQIMLCGAHDAHVLSEPFSEITSNFGATPWFYQNGKIHHINSMTSSWSENSRATINKVDICIFVILDKYGDITWNEELIEALEVGKPFIVMALESSWARYSTLRRAISDPNNILSIDDQKMLNVLRVIEDFQFTVISFSYNSFKDKLRSSLSDLAAEGFKLLQNRNQRHALIDSLKAKGKPSRPQVEHLIRLGSDEYEDNKLARKIAIRKIAEEKIRDGEFFYNICRSSEQGVQRLAFELMADLVPLPFEEELLRELAQIAERSDDVGIARRLVNSLAKLNPLLLDTLLEELGNPIEGIRRRAFESIEQSWDLTVNAWGPDRMKQFLKMCDPKTSMRTSWLERLRLQIEKII